MIPPLLVLLSQGNLYKYRTRKFQSEITEAENVNEIHCLSSWPLSSEAFRGT